MTPILQEKKAEKERPRGLFEVDLSSVIEGARKEGTVVVWAPHDIELFAPWKEGFEAKYPFVRLEFVRMGSQDLVNRALSEYRAGKYTVDLFENSVGSQMPIILEKDLMLQPFPKWLLSALETDKWVKGTYDPAGYWIGQTILPYGVVYNTQKVQRSDIPKTYEDLVNAKWKGRIVTDGNSRGGAFNTILAELKPGWGDARWNQYIDSWAALKPASIQSASRMMRSVVAGEYDIGVGAFYKDMVFEKERGAPVDWVKLDPLVVSASVKSLAKQAPHPNAALLFTHWVLIEGQKIREKADRGSPVNPLIKSELSVGVDPNLSGVQVVSFANADYWKDNRPYLDIFRSKLGQ